MAQTAERLMEWTACDPEGLTNVRARLCVAEFGYHDIVKVSFHGEFGYASAGNDDAPSMEAWVQMAHAFSPSAIVLDFRELTYSWGDRMSEPLGAAYVDGIAPAIVISDLCRAGMTSFVDAEWSSNPADFLFETEEQACAKVLERLAEAAWVRDVARGAVQLDPDLVAFAQGDARNHERRLALLDALQLNHHAYNGSLYRGILPHHADALGSDLVDFGMRLSFAVGNMLRFEEADAVAFLATLLAHPATSEEYIGRCRQELSTPACERILAALAAHPTQPGVARLRTLLEPET